MSRTAATFRKSDLTRALLSAKAAGIAVAHYEIDREGNIRIVPARGEPADDLATEKNEFGD